MTTFDQALNLRTSVSAEVHQARWTVEQLLGLVNDVCPPAFRETVDPRVERLATQILAIAPKTDPGRVGCGVFQRTPVFGDRNYPNGFRYEPISAMADELWRVENALEACRKSREGDFVICWLTEHQR